MKQLKMSECRIYGPPGTGKTTWVVKKASEIAEKVGSDQVSICSLTNSAIREVAGREILVDPENISTLHARCKRALGAPAPAESFVKEFISAYPKHSTEECLPPGLRRGSARLEGEDMAEMVFAGKQISLYERVMINRQKLIPQESWGSDLRNWYKAWDSWCKDTGRYDFTGWLETSLKHRPLPAQQVIFIDEAQDHTPLQLAVIRSWNCRQRVLVGDDDQNLYEWSGAVPEAFLDKGIPVVEEKVLEQSFRVPAAVHSEAVKWIRQIRNRKDKVYLPTNVTGKVTRSWFAIENLIDGNLPRDFLEDSSKSYMLLASCGYMLDDVVRYLRYKGIPFHNPYRKTNAKWNPLLSVSSVLDDFLRGWSREEVCWTGMEASNWAESLRAKGVYSPNKREAFLERFCGARMEEGFIKLEDLSEFFLLESLERIVAKDLTIFKDYKKLTSTSPWEYALGIYSKPEVERVPKVIVGTIHSVKGGEADNVYLFPDISGAGWENYIGHERDRITRLYYVGMTRAKNELILCSPNQRTYSVDWR